MEKKDYFRIPTYFVEDVTESGDLQSFAYFLKLKSLHAKSIIYNATKEKLARITNTSRYITSKHLKVILSNGWARYQGDHLILSSFKKTFPHRGKRNIHVSTGGSINDIVDNMRFGIIQNDHDAQKFMYGVKKHRLETKYDYTRKAAYKAYLKYKNSSFEGSDPRCITSFRRIAGLLNVGLSSAHRIAEKWKSEGKIYLSENIEYLKKVPFGHLTPFQSTQTGYMMQRNGWIINHKGSVMVIPAYL